ncbi:ATP-binding protein [Streptomyces sp. NPDC051917]|uniref:ATP-binding protein n=1 Tax=Streptomyces sp. NPDC051917 TaxID=3154754 RepID=UPI003453D548
MTWPVRAASLPRIPELTIVSVACRYPRRAIAVLPRHPRAAAQARRILEAAAPGSGTLADTAALLLSELIANAVQHSSGETLQVSIVHDSAGQSLVCAVFDAEPSMADGSRAAQGPTDEVEAMERGRGLDLMDALARTWGATSVGDRGKWVWFDLARRDGEKPARPVRPCDLVTRSASAAWQASAAEGNQGFSTPTSQPAAALPQRSGPRRTAASVPSPSRPRAPLPCSTRPSQAPCGIANRWRSAHGRTNDGGRSAARNLSRA